MQYSGPYPPRNGHQTHQPHTSSHHPRQPPSNPNTHASRYPPQQPHTLSGYPLPNAGNHSSSMLQPVSFSNHSHHDTSHAIDPHAQYYSPPLDQPNSYFSSHHHSSPPGAQYAMNPPPHPDPRVHAHSQQFIPTPSQTYQVYSGTQTSSRRTRPGVEPYYHMSPNPQQTAQRSSSPPASYSSHTAVSPSSNPALVVDRYPCDLCDRTFTRSHDRKRHYDTVHAPAPLLHRCHYCGKDFSRADSLKRHVDNGCDEMLSHK